MTLKSSINSKHLNHLCLKNRIFMPDIRIIDFWNKIEREACAMIYRQALEGFSPN